MPSSPPPPQRKLQKIKPRQRKAPRSPQAILHILHAYLTSEESGGEYRMYCPVCEEKGVSKSASASVNPQKQVWNCLGKCAGGGTVEYLFTDLRKNKGFNIRSAMMAGRNSDPEVKKLQEAAPEDHPQLSTQSIQASHKRLMQSLTALNKFMSERGLTKETLQKYEIGWNAQDGRYEIPIKDEHGRYVNLRRYLIKGDSKQKMRNLDGHGSPVRLFPVEALDGADEVVLCEGELDALILNQAGIPAVTGTHGAVTFRSEFGPMFRGKTVYICYDMDDAGDKGALRAQRVLNAFAAQVFIVKVPLEAKGADVTDLLHHEGYTAEDFRELMQKATYVQPGKASGVQITHETPSEGVKVSLEDSMSPEHENAAVELTVTIAGKQNPPYVAPKKFSVNCLMTKGIVCNVCPVGLRNGSLIHEYAPDDPAIFSYIDASAETVVKLMKRDSGARCVDQSDWKVEESHYIEELIVGNSIEDRNPGESQRPVTRTVYSVGTHKTPVNTSVKLLGTNVKSPRNSRVAFMAWKNEQVLTELDKFSMTEDEMHELSIFKTRQDDDGDFQRPLDRALEIAQEMSKNVTQIYGRDLLHLAYDLVWHSPLSFRAEGRLMDKGWLEMMVIGDTRTGKSETAMKLSQHYRSGVVKSCEGATFAGLVGGAQQIGSNWVTTWGVIPLNDRRLVVLDEVSGLKDRDVIENMSSIRSSGTAQITKITSEETSARTRLIWISNPADGTMLDEKPDVGISGMRTVVKANEDIARFDFVVAARESDVDATLINTVHKPRPSIYDSKLCERLVMWAWSLKSDDITVTPQAEKKARAIARQVENEYVPDPPLIQSANIRWKLYRIAVALAVRTFSVRWHGQEDKCEVVVYPEHVEDAYRFLNLIYDSPGMQYRSKSKKLIDIARIAKEMRPNCVAYLKVHSDTVLHALRSVGDNTFRPRDFREFAGMTEEGSSQAVKKLGEWGMLKRGVRGVISMTPTLVGVLRELDEEGI